MRICSSCCSKGLSEARYNNALQETVDLVRTIAAAKARTASNVPERGRFAFYAWQGIVMDRKELEKMKKAMGAAVDKVRAQQERFKAIYAQGGARMAEHMAPVRDAAEFLREEIEGIREGVYSLSTGQLSVSVKRRGPISTDCYTITADDSLSGYKLIKKNTFYGDPEFDIGPPVETVAEDYFPTDTEVIQAFLDLLSKK